MPYADPEQRRQHYMTYNASRRAESLVWRQQRRAERDALKSGPCVDCGQTFPPECMDWDHVNGDKLFGVGHMVGAKRDRILAEIAKCDLVCANCHRIRTRKRLNVKKAS